MPTYQSNVIVDDEEYEEEEEEDENKELEERRQIMFNKIDDFIDEKLNRNYVKFSSDSANQSNQIIANSPRQINLSSSSKFQKFNTSLYSNTEPNKSLQCRENTFKSYEKIMKKVKRKYNAGYYSDVVTRMKNIHKRLNKHHSSQQTYEDADSSSESEDEEAKHLDFLESIIYQKSDVQISPLYWQLTKVLRYIRIGNVHATLLCLCYMNNNKLKSPECMRAMEDSDGIALLLNLLSANDMRCRIGSLKILRELASIIFYCRNVTFLGGIQPLIDNLKHHNFDLQCLAAETLAKLAVFKRARSNIRRFDGISHLVYLLDVDDSIAEKKLSISSTNRPSVIQRDTMQFSVTQNAATALWKVSKSKRNRVCMRRAGVIPLLAKLLRKNNQNILIPVIGTLQQCASELYYRISIRTEGMMPILIKHLNSQNLWLRTQSALTIFKCAVDADTRTLVRNLGGIDVLIMHVDPEGDQKLLYAITGAIWKCCLCPINAVEVNNKNGTNVLLKILDELPKSFQIYLRPQISASHKLNRLEKAEKIMINVTGALYEISKLEEGRKLIKLHNSTEKFISLLQMDDENLLFNTIGVLKECAKAPDCMEEINRLDGVPILFAITKRSATFVVAAALEALKSCFANTENSASLIKSLVGSLELTVNQLESVNEDVLAATCSLIAEIGKDSDNVAILSDFGVVRLLSRLVKTDNDKLRRTLSEAIAVCSDYKDNREQFGRANVITPIVNFLRSSDIHVHVSAARALFKLSQDPNNSHEMNQAGVSHLLINMIGSENKDLQIAAAGAIGNLRKIGIEHEKQSMMKKMEKIHKKNARS